MQTNIILAGVGGQGILSISVVIDMAALKQGWHFKQAEVHGMSQRGGEVLSHLRISDKPVHSELVPKGGANLVLSVEPLESLRYVEYLSPQGVLVTGIDPFVNIPDYPDVEKVLDAIGALKNHVLVHADRLAREAGSGKAQNMVLLGAASPYLGIPDALLEEAMNEAFARKGERVQKTNLDAYRAGKAAGAAYRACVEGGIAPAAARCLTGSLARGELQPEAVAPWKELLSGPLGPDVLGVLAAEKAARVRGVADVPKAVLAQGPKAKLSELLFA